MKTEKSQLLNSIEKLKSKFSGDIYLDELQRIAYATDASAYREKPIAVTRPKDVKDLRLLID